MATRELGPNGVGAYAQGAAGSSGNYAPSLPAGDQGKGFQLSYGGRFDALSGSVTDNILLPPNARAVCVTYSYNGAGTVTFSLQGSNDTREVIKGGSPVFGTYTALQAPVVAGGTANATAVTVSLPSAPQALRGLVGGTGTAGGDTFILNVSCVATIRP